LLVQVTVPPLATVIWDGVNIIVLMSIAPVDELVELDELVLPALFETVLGLDLCVSATTPPATIKIAKITITHVERFIGDPPN